MRWDAPFHEPHLSSQAPLVTIQSMWESEEVGKKREAHHFSPRGALGSRVPPNQLPSRPACGPEMYPFSKGPAEV